MGRGSLAWILWRALLCHHNGDIVQLSGEVTKEHGRNQRRILGGQPWLIKAPAGRESVSVGDEHGLGIPFTLKLPELNRLMSNRAVQRHKPPVAIGGDN